jgi:hypothetical protein
MQAWRITKPAKIVALDKIYNEFRDHDLIGLSTHADLSQLNLTQVVELKNNCKDFYDITSIKHSYKLGTTTTQSK